MISIRRVVPEEADLLSQIAFSAKAHWGYPDRWMQLWRPQLTFTQDYFEENESWAAEFNQAPVAFYTLQTRSTAAWLENLWVSPEFIGRGVGRTLFLHALETSRWRGKNRLQLEADPNAIGFYERMGMRRIGERLSEVEGERRVLPIMEIWL